MLYYDGKMSRYVEGRDLWKRAWIFVEKEAGTLEFRDMRGSEESSVLLDGGMKQSAELLLSRSCVLLE